MHLTPFCVACRKTSYRPGRYCTNACSSRGPVFAVSIQTSMPATAGRSPQQLWQRHRLPVSAEDGPCTPQCAFLLCKDVRGAATKPHIAWLGSDERPFQMERQTSDAAIAGLHQKSCSGGKKCCSDTLLCCCNCWPSIAALDQFLCPDTACHMLLQNATASGLSVRFGHACCEWMVSIWHTWAGLFCSAVPQGDMV